MKLVKVLTAALLSGALLVIPLYLAVLLLLKAAGSVLGLVKPVAALLPAWLPAETLLAILLVLALCLLVGLLLQTPPGRAARERIERGLFQRIPGYGLFRSLTQRMAGESQDSVWRPALVEIEDALVPAFIIEEFGDGLFTIFVPSVPTPLAGAIYILERARVHPVDVPFSQAVKTISNWGVGSKDLYLAMHNARS
jgi:uncharacterized membrane protein